MPRLRQPRGFHRLLTFGGETVGKAAAWEGGEKEKKVRLEDDQQWENPGGAQDRVSELAVSIRLVASLTRAHILCSVHSQSQNYGETSNSISSEECLITYRNIYSVCGEKMTGCSCKKC